VTGDPPQPSEPKVGGAKQVPISAIERDVGAPAPHEVELPIIGFKIVILLVVLIVLVFIFTGVIACLSRPELKTYIEVLSSARGDTTDVMGAKAIAEAHRADRTAWFAEITRLLQLLVVSLLVPTLSTVIGYIFGRRQD
jgi:hypothetical protein